VIPLAYREYEPSIRLRPFVRAYFTFGPKEPIANDFVLTREVYFASAASVSPILMADMATSIVIKSGDEWTVEGLDQGPGATATLLGPMPRGHVTRVGPRINAAGVYFRVGALCNFLPLSMGELLGRGVPVDDLFGRADHETLEATYEVPDPAMRLRALESLLSRNIRHRSVTARNLVRRFYEQCMSPSGPQSIDAIARGLGVSRQYLARQIHHSVGAPPKLVARVARFQKALKPLATGSMSSAEIAADLGYYNQSHLIADFRDFAGISPAALTRARQFHPYCL
jgi:AraC-like DNA-binding protein